MSRPIVILGAGGHARVLVDTLRSCGRTILGLTDSDSFKHGASVLGAPVLGDDGYLDRFSQDEIELVNGLGSVRAGNLRRTVFERFWARSFRFASVVHPSAVIGSEVKMGVGVQVLAAAVVQCGTLLGDNSIINTSASVDHDCRLLGHVHVAPGSVVSGGVTVGSDSFLGAGCVVRQGIRIGSLVTVGAGAVVVSDIPDSITVYGVPGKPERHGE